MLADFSELINSNWGNSSAVVLDKGPMLYFSQVVLCYYSTNDFVLVKFHCREQILGVSILT